VIDVSGLEPPGPMEESLTAVASLAEGDHIRVLHRREPFPLYGILESRGFDHRTVPGTGTSFEILVWRAGDAAAEAAVNQTINR